MEQNIQFVGRDDEVASAAQRMRDAEVQHRFSATAMTMLIKPVN
jgi:hypothetical protein